MMSLRRAFVHALRRRWRAASLRQGLIVFVILTVCMTLALQVFWLTIFIQRLEADSWQKRQADAARNAVHSVTTFIHHTSNILDSVAATDSALLAANPDLLAYYVRPGSELLELLRLDAEGAIVAAAHQDEPALAESFTLIHTNWFRAAQAGRVYMGSVQLSADDTAYMTMAIPSADGGAVAARVQLQALWDVVTDIHFGNTGIVYVVNESGRILAHRRGELVVNLTIAPGWSEVSATATDLLEWQGEALSIEGISVLGTVMSVPNTPWYVITEIQQQEVYATGRTASIWLGAMVVGFGLLVVLLLVNRANAWILRPIEMLRAGAEQVGAGELGYRVETSVHNELGEVADAFNRMAAQLEERAQTLLAQQTALANEVSQRRRAQAELQVARDQALDASRTKSEFLATMSHEIRTPMHGIIGTAELLAATPLNEEQTEYLGTINGSAGVLLTLLNDILDLSKIEAGRLNLDCHVFSVHQEIENVVGLFAAVARQKGIALQAKVAPDTPNYILGDSGRVRQILLNLVGNAVKFTDQGSVTIVVTPVEMPEETSEETRPDGVESARQDRAHPEDGKEYLSIRFEVIDTGVGIAPDDVTQLFQPFAQVDGKIHTQRGGTGLGLSISRRLAELMGGEIGVTSQQGDGSSFWFQVPFAAADEEVFHAERARQRGIDRTISVPSNSFSALTSHPNGAQLAENAAARNSHGLDAGKTDRALHHAAILVAEDNLVNQKLVMKLLFNLGYAADLATNGQEAVAAFEHRKYDLVLMDCQMPKMDGYEATRTIRRLEAQSETRVPIVAMTANAMTSDRRKGMEAGMDDFLVKPFRTDDLSQVLSRWVTVRAETDAVHAA